MKKHRKIQKSVVRVIGFQQMLPMLLQNRREKKNVRG
jgi:hypothetical protein